MIIAAEDFNLGDDDLPILHCRLDFHLSAGSQRALDLGIADQQALAVDRDRAAVRRLQSTLQREMLAVVVAADLWR